MPEVPVTAPHAEGLCDWCLWPLNGDAVAFNHGIGHGACVTFMHELLTTGAEDAEPIPWPQRLTPDDPLLVFAKRLGREAAKLGINRQKLATAIARAHHDA